MTRDSHASQACVHPSAEGIFFYVQGRLEGAPLQELERHLAECDACRGRHETLDWIHAQVREWGEALFRGHVASPELVRYAESPVDLDASRRREIEEHVALCDACHTDLVILREVDAALVASTAPTLAPDQDSFLDRVRDFFSPRPAPAWAYALVLLLAVPAVFGLRDWISTERGDSVVTTLPAPQLLQPLARDASDPALLLFSPSEPLVVEFHVPILAEAAVRYDAHLELDEGERIWGSSGLQSSDEFGSFLLILETARLREGSYRLVVEEIELPAQTARERFVFPFVLQAR